MSRQRAESLLAFDQELARLLRRLHRTGELDRTIIAFTSDNGYLLGEHRWKSGKVIGFEPSYRVPLLMAGPGIPRQAQEVMPVNTVDLTASVLDWTGATLQGTDGRSFAGRLGTGRGWDQALDYEALFPSLPREQGAAGFAGDASAVGIRTARYFYVRYRNGQEELFDLREDPLELASVARDPAYDAVRAQLFRLWDDFQACGGPSCDIPLPPGLAADADEVRELTSGMEAETARYYGR